jgi:maleylacetoacetate isomerase
MLSMKLYAYFRSSTSYRARIALNLKGLKAEIVPVNLLKGEQKFTSYAQLNPEMRVPTLIDGDHTLTQSLAILEYLEEKYPSPPLLPVTFAERARVRALCLAIACDISPLNNLGPLHYLTNTLLLSEADKNQWMQHWLGQGLVTLERMLATHPATGTFCHGASPTLADCCLVPQVFSAQRFQHNMDAYPTVMRIYTACERLPAFQAAHPARQPDAA